MLLCSAFLFFLFALCNCNGNDKIRQFFLVQFKRTTSKKEAVQLNTYYILHKTRRKKKERWNSRNDGINGHLNNNSSSFLDS